MVHFDSTIGALDYVENSILKIPPLPSSKRLPAAQGFGRRGFAQSGTLPLPKGGDRFPLRKKGVRGAV